MGASARTGSMYTGSTYAGSPRGSPAAQGSACGPGIGCFQGTHIHDPDSFVNWSYVGAGRGGYEKVQTYNFVGEGCGSFDKEEETRRQGSCCTSLGAVCCRACVGLVVLALVALAVIGGCDLWMSASDGRGAAREHALIPESELRRGTAVRGALSTSRAPGRASATEAPFNCAHWDEEPAAAWSPEHRDWCCRRFGRCPPNATAAPHDCEAGLSDWERQWPPSKRVWCCASTGHGCAKTAKGCDTTCAVSDKSATCRALIQKAANKQFASSENACPLAHGMVLRTCPSCSACPLSVADCKAVRPENASTTYDCEADYNDWQTVWSVGQQAWCCLHVGRACPVTRTSSTTSTTSTYDCTSGYYDWRKLWDGGKQAWCCLHALRGCPTTTTITTTPAPTATTVTQPPATLTTTTPGPTTTTPRPTTTPRATTAIATTMLARTSAPSLVPAKVSATADCHNGCFLDGASRTCRERIVLAAARVLDRPDPCAAASASVMQRCPACASCSMDASGCAALAQTVADGGTVDFPAAKRSPEGAGHARPSTTTQYYDCDAGFSMWDVAWSLAKKRWCCSSAGKACSGPQDGAAAEGRRLASGSGRAARRRDG